MITAAADGSALGNPGPAGWAWYVADDCWAAGGWEHGTNNMGELMSVLDLLRQTDHRDDELLVLCDSQYAINCITKWMPGWKRKGWRKADGKPVLNVELLKQIDALMEARRQSGRRVRFEWVRGHAGHEMNEKADQLARAAAAAHRDGTAVEHGPGFADAGPGGELDGRPGQIEDDDLFSAMPAEDEPEPALSVGNRTPQAMTPPALSVDSSPRADNGGGDGAVVAADDGLVTELVGLTRDLLDATTRTSPARLEKLLHPDCVRHDSSGRVHTYRRMVQGLRPLELQPHLEVLGLDRFGEDVAVLRWRLSLGSKKQVVVSLWQRSAQDWQLRLEQTTPVL